MITLYEPVSERGRRFYEWTWHPDEDKAQLTFDPTEEKQYLGMWIDNLVARGYADHMFLHPDVEEWLPER